MPQAAADLVFRSKLHPGSRSRMLVQQDATLSWYGALGMVFLVLLLVRMERGDSLLFFTLWALPLAAILANLLGYIRLQQTWVEAGFVGGAFYLQNALDAADPDASKAYFPCSYSAPVFRQNQLQLTYHDRLVTLQTHEWPELLQVLAKLQQPEPPEPPALPSIVYTLVD